MYILVIIILIFILYYFKFRKSRKILYKFAESLPTTGDLPFLGHTHWFIGGPEKSNITSVTEKNRSLKNACSADSREENRRIKCATGTKEILHNIRTLVENIDKMETMCKVWIGPTLYVVTLNLDDVQKILESCMEKDSSYKFLRPWLGNGLFVAPVDLWKSHRRLLLPVFNNRIVEEYIDVFGKQGNILIKRLEAEHGRAPFDVYEYITSCMLDVVFETAMGEKMNVQGNPDTPYLRARKTVMSIINMRLFKAWLQPDALFGLTKHATTQKNNIKATHKFTDEVILKKKIAFEKGNQNYKSIDDKEGPKDILQLLLERKLNFSNVELREHIDSITIAGNDTTALVISYALMLLGMHQDEQEKVYKELKDIFGVSKRQPTKEDISKMEYLDRVIKETMRLYAVVPLFARKTRQELKLSTCTIPPGVGCAVVPFVIHRSKKIWGPDADCFNPARFVPEICATRHPCAFLPFSYGPRNCIGRHFANLAMKSILSNILRSYRVTADTCDHLKIEILLFPVASNIIEKTTLTLKRHIVL